MKLDFTQVLYGFDGEALLEEKMSPEGKVIKTPCTLGSVSKMALRVNYQDDSEAVKTQKFDIAIGIVTSGAEVELKLEDLVLLKKTIAKAFGPEVVGRVNQLLEGKTT